MTDTHHHGSAGLDLPEQGDVVALLRSVQADLAGISDDAATDLSARLDRAADGVTALEQALETERKYAAHVKKHFQDCEASNSYRIGQAIIRTGKVPKRLVDSLRSGRS
ncbi:MAG: hypothetical protein AAGA42_05365 [Actinomycetota bacterium]